MIQDFFDLALLLIKEEEEEVKELVSLGKRKLDEMEKVVGEQMPFLRLYRATPTMLNVHLPPAVLRSKRSSSLLNPKAKYTFDGLSLVVKANEDTDTVKSVVVTADTDDTPTSELHPHISGETGVMCVDAEWISATISLINSGKYVEAVLETISMTCDYNPDSQFRNPYAGTCDCGIEATTSCSFCGKDLCEYCGHRSCYVCGESICSECCDIITITTPNLSRIDNCYCNHHIPDLCGRDMCVGKKLTNCHDCQVSICWEHSFVCAGCGCVICDACNEELHRQTFLLRAGLCAGCKDKPVEQIRFPPPPNYLPLQFSTAYKLQEETREIESKLFATILRALFGVTGEK